nr:LysM peptidoglycan-binding domain-containing protein [Bacillus sp. UNC438CL73TsuS30]
MKKNLVTAAATAGLVLTAFGATANAQEPTYTVHSGDSLWKISHLQNVSINHLKEWNKLSSDKIYVNQKLSLSYTVKPGDSLWKLARENGTTVSELKNLNGLSSDLIRIGQQLKIPNSKTSTQVSARATSVNQKYVVQKGDTLSEIGARFNLSVTQVKTINHLTSDRIHVGQTLSVSGAQATSASYKVSEVPTRKVTKSKAKAAVKRVEIIKSVVAKSEAKNAVKPTTPSETKVAQKPAVKSSSTETQKSEGNTYSKESVQPAAPSTSTAVQQPVEKPETTTVQKPAVKPETNVTQKPAAKPQAEATQKPAVTSASKVQEVIAEAQKYIGTPYRWGGNTPSGFDCSGFTKYVFDHVGISIPRTTSTQWSATTPVGSPSVGDLVFFETYKAGPSHVGIYLGNNKFISAADQGVVISDMTVSYWKTRYLGARSPY